jgi:FtsH-binding integral membrane protein
MAALFRRRSTSKVSPTPTVRLGGLAATYILGVAAFVSVALLRGDDTLWSALITGAIVIGLVLGVSLWVGRMTRSDQGKLLLVVFSTLFAVSVGVMLWRGFFNWSLFTLAIAGLFVGLGGYWVTRQEP